MRLNLRLLSVYDLPYPFLSKPLDRFLFFATKFVNKGSKNEAIGRSRRLPSTAAASRRRRRDPRTWDRCMFSNQFLFHRFSLDIFLLFETR